jgi:HTH-type transcriptional regulator/antitoxin HigA
MRSTAKTPGRKNVVATPRRPKTAPPPSSKLPPKERRSGLAGYLALVKRRPLKLIQSDDELRNASDLLDQLLSRELTPDEQDYLDVLTELVHHYESAHIEMPKSTPAELVAFMAEQHGMTQTELAERLGVSEALVSAIINAKREISRSMLHKLADVFHVSPATFL